MESAVYSVTDLNNRIKNYVESDAGLRNIVVIGEISNYKVYPSGHHYFSLKDESCSVRCVLFKGNAYSIRFTPQNGMAVIVRGSISVFPRDGAYQVNCTQILLNGAGNLQIAFEQLKRKLSAEGLFDSEHKKELPAFPQRIALITSPSGAAVHDMIRILNTRWPLSDVLVVPVTVQGSSAAGEIAEAIRYVNQYKLSDLIITGRGGGSAEDLWAFNEEVVARAIYSSDIPVISAVGHEPDVTISDYVADKRASTPSNAAEISVRSVSEIKTALTGIGNNVQAFIKESISQKRRLIAGAKSAVEFRSPSMRIQQTRQEIDYFQYKINSALNSLLQTYRMKLQHYVSEIAACSPEATLSRGYCIAFASGRVITSSEQINTGDDVVLKFSDGVAGAVISSVGIVKNGADHDEK